MKKFLNGPELDIFFVGPEHTQSGKVQSEKILGWSRMLKFWNSPDIRSFGMVKN